MSGPVSVGPTDDIPKPIRDAAARWFSLIDGGTATPEEIAEFDAWRTADPLHEHAYDRTVTIWSALGTLKAEDFETDRFAETGSGVGTPARRSRLHAAAAPALAAAVALFIVVAGAFTILPAINRSAPAPLPVVARYSTGLGEKQTVTLADGSSITLGAASQIDVRFSPASRHVSLTSGAAVFDVAEDVDRPFTVTANAFSARVLGTVFDVRNSGGVVRLSVLEGTVLAAHPVRITDGASSLTVRKQVGAGRRITATSEDGLSEIDAFRVKTFAAWREDRLKYVGATLREVIADANRYSKTPIVLDDGVDALDALKVTVSFVGTDIDAVLATLPTMFPVTVDRADASQIVIRAR
ncbi:MAG: FecR domain-containing protein [Pseudomonadota bacterium]